MLALFYAGDWMWTAVTEPLRSLRQKRQSLEKDVDKRMTELAQMRKAAKTLAAWERQSLPSDPQIARSVYQAWLLQLVGRVGLASPAVDSTQPSERNGYYSMTFSLQARGPLEKWTQLLYEFYRTGHLHQIRSSLDLFHGCLGTIDPADTDDHERLGKSVAQVADHLGATLSHRSAAETTGSHGFHFGLGCS